MTISTLKLAVASVRRALSLVWVAALLPGSLAACSSDPCPPGQDLQVERFHDRFQARSKGCVDRDAEGRLRLQGRWQWFYEDGQPEAVGAYRDGRVDGAEGKTGIPRGGREGPWVFWYPSGQKKQQLSYVDGKPEGPGYQWYESGQKQFDGAFSKGRREGRVTLWHPNGQKRSVATFKDGRPQGLWTSWHANGRKKREGTYEDGEPVGTWTVWDEDGGIVYEGPDVGDERP